jgi:hypothetical protein
VKTKYFWLPAIFFLAFIFPPNIYADGEYPNFPWFTYGNFSDYFGEEENPGLKFDGYIEQGVDWLKLGAKGPVLNTFIGLNGTFSDKKEQWWNNMWGPSIGLKFKFFLAISEKSGGEISLGVREEYFRYDITDERPYDYEWRTVAFVQWYYGGNWK